MPHIASVALAKKELARWSLIIMQIHDDFEHHSLMTNHLDYIFSVNTTTQLPINFQSRFIFAV